MVNYNDGKIYKIEPICEHDEGDIYIGSTTKDYLSKRMVAHRDVYNKYKKGKYNFVTIFKLFDKYGIENCKIYLLESVNANSRDELLAREGYYIRTLKCVNKVIPDRTKKEYNEKYRQDHIEEEREKSRVYYQDHIEELREIRRLHYQNHIEELREKIREYDDKNSERYKIKFVCECGSECRLKEKSRHNKTIKHQTYLSSLQP